MMMAQITANAGRDKAYLRFHSTPAMAARVADVRMRLVMYATGNHVEDDEGSGEAGYGRRQPHQSASLEYALAHSDRNRHIPEAWQWLV